MKNFDKEMTLDAIELAINCADEKLLRMMEDYLNGLTCLRANRLAAQVQWALATRFISVEEIDLSNLELTPEEILNAKRRFEQVR